MAGVWRTEIGEEVSNSVLSNSALSAPGCLLETIPHEHSMCLYFWFLLPRLSSAWSPSSMQDWNWPARELPSSSPHTCARSQLVFPRLLSPTPSLPRGPISFPTRWKKVSGTRRNSPNCRHCCTLLGKELLTERRRWFPEQLQLVIKKTSVLPKPRTVFCFCSPQVQASLAANALTVTLCRRPYWDKAADRRPPSILTQLGAGCLTSVRTLVLPKQSVDGKAPLATHEEKDGWWSSRSCGEVWRDFQELSKWN